MSDSGCMLTISMIVKNEEANLRRCLEAARHLADAVGGEILITDTGSTDRTVEIAEELADRVLHFTWCDDFAAARNAALPYARGKWLMYLDADEILDEDLSDGLSFFQSGEEKQYNAASLCMRNYLKLGQKKQYGDYHPVRFHRMMKDTCFVGAIHEGIPFVEPVRKLNLLVHHYGYAGLKEGMREEKLRRNREILEKGDRNVRRLLLLADTYLFDREKQLTCLREAVELADQECGEGRLSRVWRLAAYVGLARFCNTHGEVAGRETLGEVLKAYWLGKTSLQAYASEMELYLFEGLYRLDRGEKKETARALENYRRLYLKYKAGQLNTPDMYSVPIRSDQPRFYWNAVSFLFEIYGGLENRKGGEALLEEILSTSSPEPLKGCEEPSGLLEAMCRCAKDLAAFDWPAKIYTDLALLGEEGLLAFRTIFVRVFPVDKGSMKGFYAAMGKLELEDNFVLCCRTCAADQSLWGETEALPAEGLKKLPDGDFCQGNPLGWILFYEGLRIPASEEVLFQGAPAGFLSEITGELCRRFRDFPSLLAAWLTRRDEEGSQAKPLSLLDWRICLLVNTFLLLYPANGQDEHEQEEDILLQLFPILCTDLKELIGRLYREEALLADNRVLLPDFHQAGFYLVGAMDAKEEGRPAEFVKLLGQAAHCCPVLSGLVQALAETARQNLLEEEARQREFASLARRIKEQISLLIQEGRYQDAQGILATYERFNPEDESARELRALIENGEGKERLQ